MKKCPFCAEKIQDDAVICRYCGKEIPKPIITKEELRIINLKNFGKGCLTTAGVLVILIFLLFLLSYLIRTFG